MSEKKANLANSSEVKEIDLACEYSISNLLMTRLFERNKEHSLLL